MTVATTSASRSGASRGLVRAANRRRQRVHSAGAAVGWPAEFDTLRAGVSVPDVRGFLHSSDARNAVAACPTRRNGALATLIAALLLCAGLFQPDAHAAVGVCGAALFDVAAAVPKTQHAVEPAGSKDGAERLFAATACDELAAQIELSEPFEELGDAAVAHAPPWSEPEAAVRLRGAARTIVIVCAVRTAPTRAPPSPASLG